MRSCVALADLEHMPKNKTHSIEPIRKAEHFTRLLAVSKLRENKKFRCFFLSKKGKRLGKSQGNVGKGNKATHIKYTRIL